MIQKGDLGDILYILAIVVFGIIGSLNKNKKKRRTPGTNEPKSAGASIWEDIKKELNMDPQPVTEEAPDDFVVTEPVEPANETVQEWKKRNYEPVISSPLERRESYTFTEERLKKESVEYSDSEVGEGMKLHKAKKRKPSFKIRLDNANEIQKGIVYAEIFNRKYV